MASQTVSSQLSPAQTHQGNTISDLDKMVENCLVTGPLMTVAQIRTLLRVEQACEECEATGTITVRGSYSDDVRQVRCPDCKGKGYQDEAVQL